MDQGLRQAVELHELVDLHGVAGSDGEEGISGLHDVDFETGGRCRLLRRRTGGRWSLWLPRFLRPRFPLFQRSDLLGNLTSVLVHVDPSGIDLPPRRPLLVPRQEPDPSPEPEQKRREGQRTDAKELFLEWLADP